MMSRLAAALVSTFALALMGCPGDPAAPAAGPTSAPAAQEPAGAPAAPGAAGGKATAPPPAAAPPAAGSSSAPEAVTVSGTVTHAGQTMKVMAAAAVWDPKDAALKLTLLPFTPTAEEMERIRKDEAFFAVMGRQKGIQGFADRTPFVALELSWPFKKDAVGDLGEAFCHLYIAFLKEAGSNMNLSFPAQGSSRSISLLGKLEPGSEITLAAKGTDELSGDTMTWDLRFQGPVLAAIGD